MKSYLLKKKNTIILILFFSVCLFLTLSKHNKTGYFNYHSEIWGDKSGYYSYLPALFIYDFKADKLPENIVERIGYGFRIDSAQNKIKTKYTCGIAILQSPFYLISHAIVAISPKENNGFQPANFKMIDFSAVFYLVLGMLFLFKFLQTLYSNKTIYISLFILFFTTNLYYYGIDETGMSHVYSFFLFSTFLYLSNLIISGDRRFFIEVLLGLTSGLVILIRPINVIFFASFFFIKTNSLNDIITRLKFLFKRKRLIVIGLFSAFVIILPQFIYWKFLTGNFIYYSYENEGFVNILKPQIFKVLFSTLNGQITYVPATIFFIIGLFYLYRKNKVLTFYISFIFLFTTYLFASWWSWFFGCGFGIRPYVDFMPLFVIPLAAFIEYILPKRKQLITLSAVVFVLIIYNLKLIYTYDGCWYGGIWDWSKFVSWVFS